MKQDKNHRNKTVPGLGIQRAAQSIKNKESNQDRENRLKREEDVQNRKAIVQIIIDKYKETGNAEIAIEYALSQPIAKSFKYFEDNGVELRTVLYNWSKRDREKIKEFGRDDD